MISHLTLIPQFAGIALVILGAFYGEPDQITHGFLISLTAQIARIEARRSE